MHYHAHVYWTDKISRAIAVGLREQLGELGCGLGRIHDRAIGPHSLPMYQAMYDDSIKEAVESYLTDNSQGISVLLHDDTGHHEKDHTDGARWIGEPIQLDIDFLRRIDAHGE